MNHLHAETDGLWEWSLTTDRLLFSPRWLALLGCDQGEVPSTPDGWLQRVHPEDIAELTSKIESARRGPDSAFSVRHRLRHRDGSYRWMLCRARVERDQHGRGIRMVGVLSDTTAETVTDPVTGLPNQRLLAERLTRALARAGTHPSLRCAVLLLDPGRSQSEIVAGSRDHAVLLNALARRLESCLRMTEGASDGLHSDLVAHLDNGQFAVLLEHLKDLAHTKQIADRILAHILPPVPLGDRLIFLPASVGVAVSHPRHLTAEQMMCDASAALHRARMLGGSRCELFDTDSLKGEASAVRLEHELNDGLARDEFRLHYQPIVSLASNEILGFEALVRWQHPVLGLILPLEFIPLAERSGFIVPLGRWILREACRQLKVWRQRVPAFTGLYVSVNLSVGQLKHPTLVEEIGEAVRESGLEAGGLTMELTESLAMENPAAIKTLLMQLRAIGVRVSIDDFGTGYSSLAHLRQLPLDTLKIDRSFVQGLEADTDAAAIIGALVTMAQQLRLQVVVEGVETTAQLTRLRSFQCDAVQGYVFARPLDPAAATQMLLDGLPRSVDTDGTASQSPQSYERTGRSTGASTMSKWVAAAAVLVLLSAGVASRVTWQSHATAIPSSAEATAPPSAEHVKSAPPSPSPSPIAVPVASLTPAPKKSVLAVIHLHRFGGCTGRLAASADGIAFTPDDRAKDAFAFKRGEFIQAATDDVLTIKSSSKTYRFTVAAPGKKGAGPALRGFTDNIASFR